MDRDFIGEGTVGESFTVGYVEWGGDERRGKGFLDSRSIRESLGLDLSVWT